MRLASRGLRDMDQGTERIDSDGEVAAVRSQARVIRRQALTGTALLAAIAMALP